MSKLRQHTKQDVWKFIAVAGPEECWPYTGTLGKDGYGQFSVMGTKINAHRVVYELSHGKVGPVVMHLCNNASCCNPKHLKEGTHAENSRYIWQSGRTKPSATGVVGVRFEKGRNRYIVSAHTATKRVVLYQGRDFEAACAARKAWEDSL